MTPFESLGVSGSHQLVAPDGSLVWVLAQTDKASSILIKLYPGQVSKAIKHIGLDELWFCTDGEGQMWRKLGDQEEIVNITPGMSLSIPEETHFQFRNTGSRPLSFFLTTVPPWPGPNAVEFVQGIWTPAL